MAHGDRSQLPSPVGDSSVRQTKGYVNCRCPYCRKDNGIRKGFLGNTVKCRYCQSEYIADQASIALVAMPSSTTTRAPTSEDDTAAHLAKLQDALLEGRIDKETYERLKSDFLAVAPRNEPQTAANQPLTESEMLAVLSDYDQIRRTSFEGRSTDQWLQSVYRKKIDLWRRAAEQGLPAGQWFMGQCCEQGLGTPLDQSSAIEWFRLSADQGFTEACGTLAVYYETGKYGLPQDDALRFYWTEKAAKQEDPSEENQLGLLYLGGIGAPVDEGQAFRLFHRAAEKGLPAAMFNLGLMYMSGKGTPEDMKNGLDWVQRAAANGDSRATELLSKYGLQMPSEAARTTERDRSV